MIKYFSSEPYVIISVKMVGQHSKPIYKQQNSGHLTMLSIKQPNRLGSPYGMGGLGKSSYLYLQMFVSVVLHYCSKGLTIHLGATH